MADPTIPTNCARCGAPLPSDAPRGLCPRCLLRQGLEPASRSTRPGAADGPVAPAGSTGPAEPRHPDFAPPEIEELAGRIPGVELIELIGRGGMGAVYRGRQPGLDRLVAVKVLPSSVGSRPGFAERFAREARALARLAHPNIVAVHDFGCAADARGHDVYWLVLEHVEGTDLRRLVRSGSLSPREALAIVPQICDALQYAHDEGVVHRDIKPENILIDRKGRVKIADFGLAKLLDEAEGESGLTRDGDVLGTPQYMAPEQIEHPLRVDHRADIFSLGVVFYEMLTGELPTGRFDPPSRRKVEVDVRLDEVVLRALEHEPDRRYQHASEVRVDVDAIRSGERWRAAPAASVPAGDALAAVRGPSTGLLVVGILNWVVAVLIAIGAACLGLRAPGWLPDEPPPWLLAVAGAVFLLTGLMMYGALKMRHLDGRGVALLAGLLAMVTSPGNLVGFPVGIWVWVVLHRPEVRAAFAARRGAGSGAHRPR